MTISSQNIYRFKVQPSIINDPQSRTMLNDAHTLGLTQVKAIHCSELYFLRGQLDETQLAGIAKQLMYDPITQQVEWTNINEEHNPTEIVSTERWIVEDCFSAWGDRCCS